MAIRLVLADDHPLILDSLAYIFSQEQDIEVLAYCRDGVSAIRAVRQQQPDIALLDVHMPGMSGLEVAQLIREEKLPTRIVLFAAEIDADEMIKAGKDTEFNRFGWGETNQPQPQAIDTPPIGTGRTYWLPEFACGTAYLLAVGSGKRR